MLQVLRSYRIALILSLLLLLSGAGLARGQGVLPTATLTVNGAETQPGGTWDHGNIQVDFNGFLEIVNYGQYSTNASLASALAAMFVRDYHSFGLYAKASVNPSQPNVITFQLVGGSGFGPLNVVDPSASFSFAGSGFASSSATTADIGVATLTINGTVVATSSYGSGSTAASIAQDLSSQAASNSANTVPVTVTSEGPNLYLQVKQPTGSYSYSYSLNFSTSQSFSTSTPASGTLNGSTDVAPITVYSYSSGYAANGNVNYLNDSVMGNWVYNYDNLNRLTSGTASGGPYNGGYTCWSYDSFGNRLSQSVSTTPCNANPPATFAASYSANNQISSVTAPTSTTIAYDAAGNVTSDGVNTYTYDAEGRVCALKGPQGMIGYQYDADGSRVGKGTVTNWQSCDITANGYIPTTDFVLDQGGGQMTELAIYTTNAGTQYQHVHSNVSAGGALIASFDSLYNPHFYLTDALGSRRVQTDAAGIPEQTCQSLPFGDQLLCTGGSLSTPTEHHFTGKERDTESGLDYFGARYYSSSMGRFSSPDPSGLTYANPYNPQSLNLYGYVQNNPLINIDPDGLDCIYINNDTGAYQDFNRGDCDNSTEDKANTGRYVDGTVDTIYTSTGDDKGVVGGYSGHNDDDSNTLISGRFDTGISQPVDMFSMSQDDRILALAQVETADSQHSFGCIAQAYKTEAEGLIPSVGVGVPLPGSKRFQGWGASDGTSLASRTLASAADSTGFPRGRYPSPTGGLFAGGKPFEMKTTPNAGRAAGRYAPYIGTAITTAVASWNLWKCL